jgi:LPS-assembly lipoprotein
MAQGQVTLAKPAGGNTVVIGRNWLFRYVLSLILCLSCAGFISGCGFKLRGSQADAHYLPPIYVLSERGSQQSIELHKVFNQAGVKLVDQLDLAVWVLTLSDEQLERRVLSVGSSGKVQEYELHYSVNYMLHENGGRAIIDTQSLDLLRDFTFTGVDVLAKADEEELLYKGMQQQVAQLILWRLLSQQKKTTMNQQAGDKVRNADEQ